MTMLRPGFIDPVADAQACFRAVLDALARPGSVVRAGVGLVPPPGLGVAAAAALLTLADADTPIWLDPAAEAARAWLAFHAGISFAPATDATFVHASALPDLPALRCGTDVAPEDSATVILEVAALADGIALRLSGPGIADASVLHVAGLPEKFPTTWAANRALYPRGVDLILTCGARLAALPRGTVVAG